MGEFSAWSFWAGAAVGFVPTAVALYALLGRAVAALKEAQAGWEGAMALLARLHSRWGDLHDRHVGLIETLKRYQAAYGAPPGGGDGP